MEKNCNQQFGESELSKCSETQFLLKVGENSGNNASARCVDKGYIKPLVNKDHKPKQLLIGYIATFLHSFKLTSGFLS